MDSFCPVIKKICIWLVTLLPVAQISNAQTGECLNFNGSNNYVLLPYGIAGSYTKEAWIKPSIVTGFPNIISGNNTALFIDNGKLTAGHAGAYAYAEVQDPVDLTVNTWYHVAVTYNANTNEIKLYKNGVEVAANTNATAYTEGVLYISYFAGGNYFSGDIDEVRVWDTVRTASEINQSRNCELSGDEPGLFAYYNFNQGIAGGNNTAISILSDSQDKCSALNGALNNFNLTGSGSNFIAPGSPITNSCAATFPNINITGNGQCITLGDTTPSIVDFTYFGNYSTSPIIRNYTIHNTGNAVLNINTINISGTNATDFSVSSPPSSNIAPGGSTNFSVSFNPSGSLGTKTATITVNNNDADENSYSFNIEGIKSDLGKSLDFDGLNDDVSVPFILSGNYTKEAWIKTNTITGFPNIFSGTGTALFLNNGKLAAGHAPSFDQAVDVTALNTNEWYHVAVSYNAATQDMKLYLNGALVLTTAAVPAYTESDLKIGSFNGFNFFWGKIDQLRVWNVVRTDTEILNSAACNISGDEPGLLAWYNFNQGAGEGDNSGLTTVFNDVDDCNAALNNATLNNFALTGTISNYVSESSNITNSCTATFPNININGNGLCIASGDVTPNIADNTDFGNISGSGISKTFVIHNTGTATLNIGAINFTGTDNTIFSVTTLPASSIAPGGSANFVVTITPIGSGVKTATITINNDDADEAAYSFNLQANVQSGEFSITNINAIPNINGTATISWSTDIATNSLVQYGTSPGNLNFTNSNATLVTNHSIQLTGLSLGVTYYFRVTSTDASSNTYTVPAPPSTPLNFSMPPSITTHPASQAICKGNEVTLSSTATSDASATVQWQISTDNGNNWLDSTGATSTSISFVVSDEDNGKQFRAIWTNIGGSNISNVAILSVNDTTWGVENIQLCGNQLPYLWNGNSYTASGTYYDTIPGANTYGCDSIVVLNLTVTNLNGSITKQYLSCIGESDGSIGIIASGGTAPYEYSINNGTSWNTTGIFNTLSAGDYSIRMKDTNGCYNDTTVNMDINKVYWNGTINNDWHTAGNWSNGMVPTASTHVIIADNTALCIISAANAEAASVQVFAGAELRTENNRELLVAGKCTSLPSN